MQIGSVKLENNAILAPLAGITDLPFRLLARESGCALVCSEMISANGLVHGSAKTFKMLDSRSDEKPLSVQIFGADPAVMADAARMVADAGADIIDINFGCSVKKVVKTGAGAALMRSPDTATALLAAVRRAVATPLTIKIRTGWDNSGRQALSIARLAESCGVDAVVVHPRTATQGFRGCADWQVIAAVKKTVGLPVVGNGDIVTAADAVRMQALTGCDGIMIGRAAIGDPDIFARYLALRDGRRPTGDPLQRRFDMMLGYVRAAVAYRGEAQACRVLRSRLGWFVKGMAYGGRFKESIKQLSSEAEAVERILAYRDELRQHQIFKPQGPTAA
jgi:tRNA-dihydrouridine synthase B